MLAVAAAIACRALLAERLPVPRRRLVLTLPKLVEGPARAVVAPVPSEAVAELAIGHMGAPCAEQVRGIRPTTTLSHPSPYLGAPAHTRRLEETRQHVAQMRCMPCDVGIETFRDISGGHGCCWVRKRTDFFSDGNYAVRARCSRSIIEVVS